MKKKIQGGETAAKREERKKKKKKEMENICLNKGRERINKILKYL